MSMNLRRILCIGRGHEWRPLANSPAAPAAPVIACKRCGKPFEERELS